jgi:hypothetical protein
MNAWKGTFAAKGLLAGFVLLALVAALSPALYGQASDGIIVGQLTDSSGAAIAGADVTAVNKATGVKHTTVTNSAGDYRLNNVQVGVYDVATSAKGFSASTVTGVQVELNHTASVNFTLQVGSVSTTVEVTGAGNAIETSTAQLETTYSTKVAEDLGVAAAGSGIWNLSLLGAGVASSGGIGQGTGPSVAGQRPENNTFSLDGVLNDNHYSTGPQVYVANDAIAEFTLLQNQFSPEFGNGSGGIFNAVVKSGTNSIHGSVYEYLQNRNMNALDQQQRIAGLTSQPRYDNNRLGATIGGPIMKNKLFYFADFEYNPVGQASVPAGEVDAPTAAGLATLANIPGVSTTNLNIFKQYVAVAPVASGTSTVSLPNGTTVSIPTGALAFASPNYSNSYDLVTAIDFNISAKDQLRGRYIYNDFKGLDNVAALPVFYEPEPNVNNSVSVSEFHNFSPTMENELRISYSRNNQNVTAGNFKFPGLDVFPNLSIDDLGLQIGPDPNTPTGSIENLATLQENLTKNWGKHTFKAGYSAFDVILAGYFVQRARGDYDYSTLGEFLLDQMPDGGNISGVSGERTAGAPDVPFGFFSHAFYVNDDYRLRSNLTINLGLRFESTQVPVGSRYQSASVLADIPGVVSFNEPKGSGLQWSPRVGVAWSPGDSGKWSVRGGFARSFDNTYINLNQNSSPAYYATTLDCPDQCAATGFLASGGLKPSGGGGGWTSVADARSFVSSYIFDMDKRPYAMTGTLGVQRSLGNDYTVEVRYVYTKGVHLWNQTRMNIDSKVTPTNYLPTYTTAPSASQIAQLTTTLAGIKSGVSNVWAQYGIGGNVTGYHPWGNSRYNGLATQMNKRYSSGFQYIAAFTWSHGQDDSTATNFSTIFSPRRAQDFQNMRAEWANSALDRRARLTLTPMYDFRPFRQGNWLLKNVVGNWNISGTYTFQSPEMTTVQSGVDSNLNGDSAGDRSIINPAGQANVGSGVTAITNAAGDTVAYLANNPNARYIVAGPGALSNSGRNTLPLGRTDNIDMSLTKLVNVNERMAVRLGVQLFNALNHAQFVGGALSDVKVVTTDATPRNFLVPSDADFNNYQGYVSSNPRSVQLVAKFTF